MGIEVTKLENGVRVACQKFSHVDSVALNVMFGVGSRFETEKNNGISHMLEHMAFKGTEKRSAKKIAEEFDNLGGYLNAYTSRETTSYHAKLLKHHWKYGLEVLSDILLNSTMPEDELIREKLVVNQEILEARDNPDDVVFDIFQEVAYPDQPMGRAILGTTDIVNNMTRAELMHRMIECNHPENIVVAVTGNIDPKETIEEVKKYFSYKPINGKAATVTTRYEGGIRMIEKDFEQIHVNIGFDGLSYKHDDYYTQNLLSTILGGGMSSRLFQEVREKRGLAYHIGTFVSPYSDGCSFGVNASSERGNFRELVDVCLDELQKVTVSVDEEEINRAKSQMISGIAMASESTGYSADEMAKCLIAHDRYITNEEVFEKIQNVTKEDILRVGKDILSTKLTFAAVGPLGGNLPNIPEKLI
jgi:predicted Zn-dependent peptidase